MEQKDYERFLEFLKAKSKGTEWIVMKIRGLWQSIILNIIKYPVWALFAFLGLILLLFW